MVKDMTCLQCLKKATLLFVPSVARCLEPFWSQPVTTLQSVIIDLCTFHSYPYVIQLGQISVELLHLSEFFCDFHG